MSCCIKPGRVTSNGYLNFLRDFRRKCCTLTGRQAVEAGAKAWKRLSSAEREKYRKAACGKRMKPSCKGCKRRKRSCKRKSKCKKKRRRSCPRPKGKCTRTGPVTTNAYLNFLRAFRRCNCNLTNSQIIRLGARKWCGLPDCMKDKFKRQACKVAKSCRMKKRKICQSARKKRKC